MANVKISDLTAAASAAGANEYEINEAGTSKKVTGTQISAFVKADLLDDTTVNFTGTLQNGGSNVVVDSDIGSTVQGYDADTAKLDTAQTWTATQTYGDNVKQQFGAGNDLQIYHSGTASYVSDTGTGNLVLQGTNVQLRNAGDTANYLVGTDGGATSIQYNGSTKLATTSGGVSVTGTCTATAFSGDGSALTGIATGGGFSNMQVFTGSGTWTNPGSITKVKVTVAGAGGGGGGSGPGNGSGGGGGGGGTAIEVVTIPTSPVPVTVGGAGAAGGPQAAGGTGGTSSFGAYCSATGGTGGPGNYFGVPNSNYGGDGGSGSGGNLNLQGGHGSPALPPYPSGSYLMFRGMGGSSHLAGNSRSGGSMNAGPGNAGATYGSNVNGKNYGGGGGGATSNGDTPGGAGAPGVVIVEW